MTAPDSPRPIAIDGYDALVERIARAIEDHEWGKRGLRPWTDSKWRKVWRGGKGWEEIASRYGAALSALQPGDRVGPGGAYVVRREDEA